MTPTKQVPPSTITGYHTWRLDYKKYGYPSVDPLIVMWFHARDASVPTAPVHPAPTGTSLDAIGVRYTVLATSECGRFIPSDILQVFPVLVAPRDTITLDHGMLHWFPPDRARALWRAIRQNGWWSVAP